MLSIKASLPMALCAAMSAQAGKIAVDRERMVNLSAQGDVWSLFDEQDPAGDPKAYSLDPKSPKPGAPTTQYTSGWVKLGSSPSLCP